MKPIHYLLSAILLLSGCSKDEAKEQEYPIPTFSDGTIVSAEDLVGWFQGTDVSGDWGLSSAIDYYIYLESDGSGMEYLDFDPSIERLITWSYESGKITITGSEHRFYDGRVTVSDDIIYIQIYGYLEPNLKTAFKYKPINWVPISTPL